MRDRTEICVSTMHNRHHPDNFYILDYNEGISGPRNVNGLEGFSPSICGSFAAKRRVYLVRGRGASHNADSAVVIHKDRALLRSTLVWVAKIVGGWL